MGRVRELLLMRLAPLAVLGVLVFSLNLDAQIFGGPARRVQKGPTLPATCVLGDIWFDDNAAVGSQFYLCTVANTWTAGVGGSSGLALQLDNSTIGTET